MQPSHSPGEQFNTLHRNRHGHKQYRPDHAKWKCHIRKQLNKHFHRGMRSDRDWSDR
jgi:hypothetical protein